MHRMFWSLEYTYIICKDLDTLPVTGGALDSIVYLGHFIFVVSDILPLANGA